jgi:hypothetical protein
MWNQCAQHSFSTDAMELTGNLMAVMNLMDHSKPEVKRIYHHPDLMQIGAAVNKRNQAVQ